MLMCEYFAQVLKACASIDANTFTQLSRFDINSLYFFRAFLRLSPLKNWPDIKLPPQTNKQTFFQHHHSHMMCLILKQGPHCTGEIGKMAPEIPCQEKHREFGNLLKNSTNFAKIQGKHRKHLPITEISTGEICGWTRKKQGNHREFENEYDLIWDPVKPHSHTPMGNYIMLHQPTGV